MQRGIVYALSGYFLWGIAPLFWRLLREIDSLEVLAHRMVWSPLTLLLVLLATRNLSWIRPAFKTRKTLLTFSITAVLLGVNWGVFIWAISVDRTVDASLGYFINPLLSVMLGMLFLGETMRPGQWAAVAVAAFGVAYLTWVEQTLPWIGLVLAVTFGLYGLMRKTADLNAIEGLSMETGLLLIPALLFMGWLAASGELHYIQAGLPMKGLLMLAGAVTVIPLLFFSAGARRIPLAMVGIFQYIAPSLQFLLGVLVFREPFTTAQLIGYVIIWVALALYTLESLRHNRRVTA